MRKRIYPASAPWFHPGVIGLLFESQDPHRSKGELFSESESDEGMEQDQAFADYILGLEDTVTSLTFELSTLKQVVREIAGELGFYADKERPSVEKGGKRARECLEKYKDVIDAIKENK